MRPRYLGRSSPLDRSLTKRKYRQIEVTEPSGRVHRVTADRADIEDDMLYLYLQSPTTDDGWTLVWTSGVSGWESFCVAQARNERFASGETNKPRDGITKA
jgi:hypothetical protein